MKKNIELIEAYSDLGAGTCGASFGAEALQIKSQHSEYKLLSKLPKKACYIPFQKGFTSSFARNIELVYNVCKSISIEVSDSLRRDKMPLVISGDHSCAAGTIAGIKIAKPHSRLGVVWIDAHADFHSPYTSPSGNMHGMPLAASINEDNMALAHQNIDTQTLFFWEKFKNLGNLSPKVLPQDIVYVSLRDFEKEEASLIKTHGIKCITTETLRRCGINSIVDTVLKQLDYCTDIYVSFDTDSLDASISKGTGLPVKGGLMSREAELLVELLMENPKISCLEFTELNPFFDINMESTTIIYQILEKALKVLQKEKATEQIIYQNS